MPRCATAKPMISPAPSIISNEQYEWPPNYVQLFAWRQQQLNLFRESPDMMLGAREYYKTRPVDFICDWVDTYDPRNAGQPGKITRMPFVMFPRQIDMVHFIMAILEGQENGLIEKCRDAGATWICCAISVWLWIYWPGISIGWGSRKEQLVDKLGVIDSIFEKIRMVIRGLPKELLPWGFDERKNFAYMRIINPYHKATIVGEAGDNIGRGGRTRLYFLDESAHIERPELVQAALGDNTRCVVDISSVNGTGNVFHRKREAGVEWESGPAIPDRTNVFVFDWSHHPEKTREWYEKRKANAIEQGLYHIFAQEVDRDYSSAVEGIIIKPEWVRSAVDAHIKLGIEITGPRIVGLDVADGGLDKNAFVSGRGCLIDFCQTWGAPDTGVTARRAVELCQSHSPTTIYYDVIGVGAGVKSEVNRLAEENLLPKNIQFHPWNAAAKVLDPDKPVFLRDKDSPLNKDHFANLKAQAWFRVSQRFFKTWQAVNDGVEISPEDVVSLDSNMPDLDSLMREFSQATASLSSSTMKVVVDKTPDGTRSPNRADAAIMRLFPLKRKLFTMMEVG